MNRRDFLERLLFVLSAALFALFGIRPDVEPEEILRTVKATARELEELELQGNVTSIDIAAISDILKHRYSEKKFLSLAYQEHLWFSLVSRS